MYEAFAAVYDRLMDDVDYPRWAKTYADQLGLCPKDRPHIVECGCGTGSLSIALAQMGFRVTGIDQSPAMLEIAMAKARRAGLTIPFIRQDMRRLSLHKRADALIAPCDAINYLLREADLLAFLTAASAALKPGGKLGLDFSSPHKLLHTLAGQFYGEEREDLCYLWQTRSLPGALVELDLTFFEQEADGRYRRFQELQRQRAWTLEEVLEQLARFGFSAIRTAGEDGLEEISETAPRYHIYATFQEATDGTSK